MLEFVNQRANRVYFLTSRSTWEFTRVVDFSFNRNLLSYTISNLSIGLAEKLIKF